MTAFCVVFSLLFSQLALARYVCPTRIDASPMADMAASRMPCEAMDEAQPVLCHQHAVDAAQAFEVLKVVSPSLPAVIQVLVSPVALEPTDAGRAIRLATAEAQPPPDPLFLSTLRLRV